MVWTMTKPVVVVGAGGMGRCVLDVIDVVNRQALLAGAPALEVVGVIGNTHPDEGLLAMRGVQYLGDLSKLERLPSDVGYLVGIGSPAVRRRVDAELIKSGRPSPVLLHPNAHFGFDVQFGPGTVVCSNVSIENHVRLGRHVHVNQNATIGHDTIIDHYCTISPLAAISGNVSMELGVFVGTGATVNERLSLHTGSTVGAGAAVIDSVQSGTTVVGVPARPVKSTMPRGRWSWGGRRSAQH